jgi:hypothetical protein
MARTAALPILTAESGLSRYLEEIRRFPMLEPQNEYMLAKRWREHGDRDAATSWSPAICASVAKIAMGYRGYGLPISEVISEGNVGLMQAVKRFEPEKGLPPRHLRHVVDQGGDPGIHPALVVAGEDGHHRPTRRSCSSTCARPRARSRRWKRATCVPTRSSSSPSAWA